MGAIELRDKPIAITGASSGIGAATAIACAAAGMPVALGARRADKLQNVVDRITASGGRAIAVTMDVRSDQDNQRLIDRCVQNFGSIYAVYANAGYGEEAAVHEMSDHQVREMFETNFFGTLSTVRAALPRLMSNAPGATGVRGHVLICSSCLGKLPVPYYGVYSATKAAQNHIGRAMNLELRGQGVRVSTVHPIGTRTEFFGVMQERSGDKPLRSLHTPESMMQPAELVARKTVECLHRPRAEVWTGPKGLLIRAAMAAAMVMPGVMDRVLAGMLDRSAAR